jgi:membrane protein YqaA with SNARE-associated domain
MKPAWSGWVTRALLLLLIIGFSVFVYLNRDQVSQLEGYGYPGIFVFNLLSNATLILPLPGVAVTSLMGAVFNPFWVAIAAGSGAALGELSGYLAGFSGRVVVERTPNYERVENWMKRFGSLAVLVLAFVPNPLFDIAGIIAGALRMNVWRFLLFCWIGKVIKMLFFAYAGTTIVNFFPLK